MKKLLLMKTVLLLCALIVGSGTMWGAENDTHDFSQSLSQLLNNNASISPINIAEQSYPIKEVIVTYRTTQSASKFSMAVTVGSTNFGSYSSEGKKSEGTTQSFSASSTQGAITITFTNNSGSGTGKGTLYVTNVRLVEGAALSSGEVTTTTIDASGITNTNKFVSTAAGSLSATVKDNSDDEIDGATVTWSGDNDEVATINASTGAVTLVGAGTVTFTASYAGVADTYQSSYDTYEMTVTDEDPDLEIIWSEDFSTFDEDDVPAGGTYSYVCTNGTKTSGSTNGGTTAVKNDNLAGGTALELMVGKKGSGEGAVGGTFVATITLLNPTYAYSGDLTLKFKSNANSINVKTTTDGITVDGEENEGDGVTFSTKDTHKVTFKGVTTSTEDLTIVFTATSGNNVRLDDIVLKGKQAELSVVATPSISPASGAVVSGTEVTMTCLTDGATIYYTTNGDTPTSGSTPYDPEDKPTITSACTIKAIGIKAGLTNSEVASASYTIAEPCATPTFSVAEGEVSKGTTVTISCATDGATIYYTTNGSTPTTSSSVYSSAITINTNQTIKAVAVKDGNANSEVASATYTVIDYTTLPFNWAGGTSSSLAAVTGVTTSGLGSDYGSTNAPYYVKMDGVGDYIQIKTNAQPVKVLVGIKMVGGGSTSKIKVQESADGSVFTDVNELTISGAQNAILNLATTNSFATTTRYVKIIKSVHGSNIGVGPIMITDFDGIDVTITSAEYATYCNATYPLDFTGTGITAYTATDNTTYVKLNEITSGQVPANTPVVLYKDGADGTTINVPVVASADAVGENDLNVVGAGGLTGEDNIFVLAKKNGTVGFYLWDKTQTLNEGKIYLQGSAALARSFLGLGDDTTGIKSMNNGQLTIDNEAVYDLQGRKVAQPTKGLYIVNGKKVVKK